MSPFIVTTMRPCPEGHTEPVMQGDGGGSDGSYYHTPPCEVCGDRCEIIVSRVAVATLEKATAEAERAVRRWRDDAGTREAWDASYAPLSLAANLPEAGGTVGPLPNGSLIEVEPTTWGQLGGHHDFRRSNAEVLAASR